MTLGARLRTARSNDVRCAVRCAVTGGQGGVSPQIDAGAGWSALSQAGVSSTPSHHPQTARPVGASTNSRAFARANLPWLRQFGGGFGGEQKPGQRADNWRLSPQPPVRPLCCSIEVTATRRLGRKWRIRSDLILPRSSPTSRRCRWRRARWPASVRCCSGDRCRHLGGPGSSAATGCPNSGQASLRHSYPCSWASAEPCSRLVHSPAAVASLVSTLRRRLTAPVGDRRSRPATGGSYPPATSIIDSSTIDRCGSRSNLAVTKLKAACRCHARLHASAATARTGRCRWRDGS